MKFIYLFRWAVLLWPSKKMLRIMKIFIIIMTAFLMQVSASSFAQKITIRNNSITLKQAFSEIRKQTGFIVIYKSELLNKSKRLKLDLVNTPLEDALNTILAGQNLEFSLKFKSIIVKQKEEPSFIQKMMNYFSNIDVSGRVVDDKGAPIAGATVKVKGTNLAVATNSEGRFTIKNISEDSMLEISSIGFKALEMRAKEQLGDLKMDTDISKLEQVSIVSTGYQDVPLERATGSFSKVDNEIFNRQISTDVISRLKGIAPSVLFDQRNGQNNLTIRGMSTIFANAAPLIVLDNFPYDGDINNINPNDVEDITILKDAAAASIWGVRAGNGVIVIRTKKGKKNQDVKVQVNSNITVGKKTDLFYQPRMTTGEFIDMEKFLFDKGYFTTDINNITTRPALSPVVEILAKKANGGLTEQEAAAQLNLLRNYDIRDDINKFYYQNSINQQYNFNVQGGLNKYTYYFSAGLDNNKKNTVGNENKRITLTTRQQFEPLKNLVINADLFYSNGNTDNNNSIANLTMGNRNVYPYARLVDDAGNAIPLTKNYRDSFIATAESQGLLNWQYIPLNDLNTTDSKSRLSDLRATTGINYVLTGGLTLDLKYQYENQLLNNRVLQGVDSYFTRDLINRYSTIAGNVVTRNIPLGGILTFSNNSLQSHNFRSQVNYSKSFGKHEIVGLTGFEMREVVSDGNSSRQYGYDEEIGSSIGVNYTTAFRLTPASTLATIPRFEDISKITDRLRSYYANAAYTYNSRYTFSVSGRLDQSNIFGVKANQRTIPLWSSGLKWNINKEDFYNLAWMPVLTARVSYGYNGNYDPNLTAFTTAQSSISSIYSGQPTARIVNPPNNDLRWEKSRMFNIGLDFTISNNIISGSLEYFSKKGEDLIGTSPTDPTTGLATFRGNVASMKGKGIDVLINTNNTKGKFKWSTNLLYSYAVDEITDYKVNSSIANFYNDQSITRVNSSYTPVVGKPLFSIYSAPWAGLDSQGNPQGLLNGQASISYAAINSFLAQSPATNLIYHGRALPPHFGAIRNIFNFGNWSASFNITYRFNYYFHRQSINYTNLFGGYRNAHSEFSKRWQNPGEEAITNVPSMIYPANATRDSYYNNAAINVLKGDNIRLQDFNIGYSFKKENKKWLPFNNSQINLYLNNLGLIWTANDEGIDPDYPTERLPLTASIGLRINL